MTCAIDALTAQITFIDGRIDTKVAKYERRADRRGKPSEYDQARLAVMREQLHGLKRLETALIALRDDLTAVNTPRMRHHLQAIFGYFVSPDPEPKNVGDNGGRLTPKVPGRGIYAPKHSPWGSEKTLAKPWVCVLDLGRTSEYLEDKFGHMCRYATREAAQQACDEANRNLDATRESGVETDAASVPRGGAPTDSTGELGGAGHPGRAIAETPQLSTSTGERA